MENKNLIKIDSVNHGKKNSGDRPRDIVFQGFSSSLLSDPIKKHEFLIDGLIYDKCINLISGDTKTYKTYVAIDMAIGVLTGQQSLGHNVLKQGGVLFISTEFDTRMRFIHALNGRGIIDHSNFENLIVPGFNCLDTFKWNKDLLALESLINQTKPKLLVLDPLTFIFDGDINSGVDVEEFFTQLKRIIRQYDLSILLLHHNNRMNDSKKHNNVSGSSALTRFSDSIIYLDRLEDEEYQDISKSDEELNKEMKSILLTKGLYRHGKEGYKYHQVNFEIIGEDETGTAIISTQRYDKRNDMALPGKNVPKKVTTEFMSSDIINKIQTGELNRDNFSKKDVLIVLPNTTNKADSTYTRIIDDVLADMRNKGRLGKADKGRGYKFLG